jgi:hypothetical protein
MLNPTQTLAAAELLSIRPAVIPGTRAIIDRQACEQWFDNVVAVMRRLDVTKPAAVNAFCDLAGVPD